MKKKILITLFVAIMACAFAFTVSAANEVTLTDGTSADLETVFKVSGNTVNGFNTGYSKDNVQDVVFPESITTIKSLNFENSTVIKTVTFEAKETLVLENVTFKASSVEKVTFNPDCVLNYKSGSFYNCQSLTEITFPKFLGITGNCFQLNKKMVPTNGIVFVEGVTTINCHIFNGCNNVGGTITFPSTLVTIKEGTFNGTAITAFDFSKCASLTSIGGGYGGTFANIDTVKRFDFSACESLTKFDGNAMFEGCEGLEEVILPANLGKIPHKTFAHCYKLQSILIPASVTTIADESFHSARRGQSVMTFTMYIQGDVQFSTKYVFRDSGAKVELVLLGDGITASQFKTTNAGVDIVQSGSHSPVDKIEVVSYLGENGPFVPGQARTSHVIVEGYCSALALNGDHVSGDNPCVILCTVCGLATAKENPEHNESVAVLYENGYGSAGIKQTTCTNEGCAHKVSVELAALFECLGYSAAEFGEAGFVIGYTVNKSALADFRELTGKTVQYGVFVVSQEKLGENDIFGADGSAADGVLYTNIYNVEFTMFQLKVVGFAANQVDKKFAAGAYVIVDDGEKTEYSYIQCGTPADGEKYYFVSYSDIVG